MKHVLYLNLGVLIILPAILLIFSDSPVAGLFGILYAYAIYRFIPKRFWRKFWKANIHFNKLLEG